LEKVISRSAISTATKDNKCIPILIKKGDELFKSYTLYYKELYKKCPKIQSYQIFKTDNKQIGSISCNSPFHPNLWDKYLLLVKIGNSEEQLRSLPSRGLPLEKKWTIITRLECIFHQSSIQKFVLN
jgi:hypothetical protein